MGMEATTKKEDLICKPCLLKDMSYGSNTCKKHGASSIDWKCMFCCSVAVYFCAGKLWFCEECHGEAKAIMGRKEYSNKCKGGADCPLGVAHPPAGNDHKKNAFPLGCSICRSENLEKYAAIQNVEEEESPQILVGYDFQVN